MKTAIYLLNFKSAVHFGKKRLSDNQPVIKADTLFSALFIEALKIGQNTEYLLNDLIISNTFPYLQGNCYLPKPLINKEVKREEVDDAKIFKKLEYIPVDRYLDFINEKFKAEDAKDCIDDFLFGSNITFEKVAIESKQAIEREETQPYTIGAYKYNKDCGLYFIAQGAEQSLHLLEENLNSLQYSGIGGKRFSGLGQFEYSKIEDEELDEIINSKGEKNILLSNAMFEVNDNDVLQNANYILEKRSGFIQSNNFEQQIVKKRDYFTFIAGSVFDKRFKGHIVNVGVDGNHPVYRYAKAFWIGV